LNIRGNDCSELLQPKTEGWAITSPDPERSQPQSIHLRGIPAVRNIVPRAA
jgi:hypothetical protein